MVQAWQHTGLRSHFDHPGPILHMLSRTEKRDRAWQPAKLFFQVMKDHSDPGPFAHLSTIVRDRHHFGWPNLSEALAIASIVFPIAPAASSACAWTGQMTCTASAPLIAIFMAAASFRSAAAISHPNALRSSAFELLRTQP